LQRSSAALAAIAAVCLSLPLASSISPAREARDPRGTPLRPAAACMPEEAPPPGILEGGRGLMTAAAVDTYCLVRYDFETMEWQGWTRVDRTAQADTFFHVDDFAGLGGGSSGLLSPIEGTRSAWCGTRPGGDTYLCSWGAAPGYGNGWDQVLVTGALPFAGALTLSFHARFDSEPGYDYTRVEHEGLAGWEELAAFDGKVDTIAAFSILPQKAQTKLRFHFVSDAAWSDQDGLWDTDGACIVDSITVSDRTGTLHFEDFESYAAGELVAGFWNSEPGTDGYGRYSGLHNGLYEHDPCGENFSAQVVFFVGSPYPSVTLPGLFDTPYCTGPGGIEFPCQNEVIVSPVIDNTRHSTGRNEVQDAGIPPEALPGLGGTELRYTVYRDLPLENLVFYIWDVRSIVGGCPERWLSRDFVYYGPERDYLYSSHDISDLAGAHPMQVRIGVVDMCGAWYNTLGNCATHTPAPWFDNVGLYRYDRTGPQWSCRDLDLFQDTFPGEEYDIESYCRIDAANDLRAGDDPAIDPGDSAVVTCGAPMAGGLDTLPTGEDRVYMHVNARYIGAGTKPDLSGPQLAGTYGSYAGDDGDWTVLHCPTALTGAGTPASGRYMIDLNDSLFTRGYMIEYYFEAFDLGGNRSTLPKAAGRAGGDRFEMTCLPTLTTPWLYVDDFHGRGTFGGTAQVYFDPAFRAVLPSPGLPDRYDVNSPSSMTSNGPGSRARRFHMTSAYEAVIWDSGNLRSGTISEGTDHSDKSNDARMLVDWLMNSEHGVGLWVLGDGIASDLDGSRATVALELMSAVCGVSPRHSSYFEMTGGRVAGGVVAPLLTGIGGTPFEGIQYHAFGGCPIINSFDVLTASGNGAPLLRYPDYNSVQYYAGIFNRQLNNAGYPVSTVWLGHSMMYVRDGGTGIPVRNRMLERVAEFFQEDVNVDITGDEETPAAWALSQNHPNPFNPVTTVEFSLARRGRVDIKVYEVSGAMVRVLAGEVMEAGAHEVVWDGTNGEGRPLASGVYFCRMRSGEFAGARKMVLLR